MVTLTEEPGEMQLNITTGTPFEHEHEVPLSSPPDFNNVEADGLLLVGISIFILIDAVN